MARPANPEAPRQTKAWLWIVLVPLGLVALAVVTVLGDLAESGTGPPTPAERRLLVDLDYLSAWFDHPLPPGSGNYVRTRNSDKSVNLQYDLSSEREDIPFINHIISFELDQLDAFAVYFPAWRLIMKMAADEAITVDEIDDGFSWGDESRFGVLRADGQPIGNAFVARRRTLVVYFIISGFAFDEPETFAAMMLPKLDKLAAHQLESTSR